jgi:hypothetical protein
MRLYAAVTDPTVRAADDAVSGVEAAVGNSRFPFVLTCMQGHL